MISHRRDNAAFGRHVEPAKASIGARYKLDL